MSNHPNSLKNLKPIQKGQVLNPNGRKRGSRSLFAEAFFIDVLSEWEEGGLEAIRTVRETDPSTFLRVAASIIPKEFTLNDGESTFDRVLDDLTDGEIGELITGLKAIGSSEKVREGNLQAGLAQQSRSIH